MKEMPFSTQENSNYVLFCVILSPANDRPLARNYLYAGRGKAFASLAEREL